MALIDRKINDWSQPVSSLDDKPQMTAAALKAAFDSNSNQLKPAINGIIDDLTGSQGALNIGLTPIDGLSGGNVQAVLQAVSLLLKNKDIDISNLERLFTADGASLVGLQPVSGVSASNLQQAIISLADTISKIDPYLGNAVPVSQGGTGAKTAQQAIYNLGCMPRENLLDNAYFIGGGDFGKFPVNQKGKKIYTNDDTWHNSIDRWRYATTATLNILDDCLQISDTNTRNDPSFSQFKSQSFKAGRYTISALCKCSNKVNDNVFLNLWTGKKWATENFEFQYNYKVSDDIDLIFVTVDIDEDTVPNDCYCTLFAMGNTIDLYAMKLEEGDFQTLAWKDNKEKWHLFETPDYASVFRDCLRYYVEFRKMEGPINEFKNNNLWSGHCQAISTDELLVNYQFPVPMRTIPAISVYAKGDGEEMVTINKVRDSSTGASVDISGFTCSYVTNFGFAIIRKQGAFVQSRFYDFIIVANAEL